MSDSIRAAFEKSVQAEWEKLCKTTGLTDRLDLRNATTAWTAFKLGARFGAHYAAEKMSEKI
jgi:hypothetical protein